MGSGGQIKTGAWDPEEDDLLYYWQSKVGNKWSEVAKHIPGRTGQQCAQRWRHKVNPNIRRDKWTADEDAKLIELVKTFGVGRWAEIARNCEGRTDQQCMGRWRRHLDPSIRRDCWSPEEDAKLRQLHAQYGTSWSRISKNLKGRTSQQCRARWHQINNTRSKSCGSGAGVAPAATGGCAGGRQGAGRKAANTKRRTSRRRHDSSCSEDDEEEEEEDVYVEDEEDEQEEEAEEPGGSSGGHSGTQQIAHEQHQQQDYAAAVAAAAAAAGYAYGAAELQQPWVASLAAGMIHGALSSTSDPALQAALQQQVQQHSAEGDGGDAAGTGDEDDGAVAAAAAYVGQARHHGSTAQSSRFESSPAKLGGAAGAAAAAAGAATRRGLKPSGSLEHSRKAAHAGPCSSPGAMWPAVQHQQQFADALTWSPSRLLLSPHRPEHRLRNGRATAAAAADASKDMNEEEAAGAETLLEMASLLQQESCELQPALPLPAYTPPKRPAGDRLEEDLPDGLSPSPFKRARNSRGALFAEDADGCVDGSMSRRRVGRLGSTRGAASQFEDSELLEDEEPGPQASPATARRRRGAAVRHFRAPHGAKSATAAEGEADEAAGLDAAAAAAGAAVVDADGYLGSLGLRSGGGLQPEQAEQAGRPSNASSLTGFRGQDTVAAAAAAVAAAVFMSPPPAVRGSRLGAPGSATFTPNRPAAQHSVMGLLGSPMFERMVGCATPPSAGRTQPSAATLAALQSPQPSRVPEPFWTPFTGLFQDALFSRGTSATPDLPSAGKPWLPRGLFSPAVQRSGSASGGKVVSRRSLLHGGDVGSPLGASVPDMDEDRLASQPSGGSAERPSAGAASADADTGPSPAAACGLQAPPLSQVHHRVVRRLDQHEAWGGISNRPSPGKQARNGDGSSTKRDGLNASGTGLSLFSPVKKQRVPLFNEATTIKVGATPSKPEQPDADQLLPIAPLKHNLPEPGNDLGACNNLLQQPHGSPLRLAAAAASTMLHGRSPLGVKARDRPPTQVPVAAMPAGVTTQQRHRQQPQQQAAQQQAGGESFRSPKLRPELEAEQQEGGDDAEQEQQGQSAAVNAGAHEAQGEVSSPALERAGSINQRPLPYDEPDTPVNEDTADKTSCSGTPNTPAGVRGEASGGAQQQASPCEYVTPPQHRLRASRPLAPLHKDCLIAAATRSLADGLAQQQQQRQLKQPTSSAATASAGGAVAAAAAQDSPGQYFGDSSRIVSCERVIDSPVEAGVLTHSPSQWHHGMVAMLRSLQQTPLQLTGLSGAHGAALAEAAPAAGGSPAVAATAAAAGVNGSGTEVVNIKVCSRALRRLQDELEQGSAATAAAAAAIIARQQQQQQQQGGQRAVKQEQQQQQPGALQDTVPFSAGLSLGPGLLAGASCSTPLVLPLFTSPAALTASSHLPRVAGHTAGAARPSPSPLALASQCSSGVASVSLTPAVVTLHAPAASATVSAITPRMPAVAWPVQQRSDGGLVVSAPLSGSAAVGAAAAATGGTLVQLTPAASSSKAAPAATASPLPSAATVATPAASSAPGCAPAVPASAATSGPLWQQVSPLSVVSIQPLTLLATACNAAMAAGQAAALQSVLALQPATACASAAAPAGVVPAVGVPAGHPAAGGAAPTVRDSSHTVRSRLHALIDSV